MLDAGSSGDGSLRDADEVGSPFAGAPAFVIAVATGVVDADSAALDGDVTNAATFHEWRLLEVVASVGRVGIEPTTKPL